MQGLQFPIFAYDFQNVKSCLVEKAFFENKRIYQSCLTSAMLYGSKRLYLRKNEIATLRRTEKVVKRVMCRVELIKKQISQELMDAFDLEDTLDRLAIANRVQWYGHVLRRNDDDYVLRRALDFQVVGRRECRPPKMTEYWLVKEQIKQIGLKIEETIKRTKWRSAMYELSRNVR